MNSINFFNGSVMNSVIINGSSITISGVTMEIDKVIETAYKRLLAQARERIMVLEAALNREFPIEDLVDDHYATEEQGKEMDELIQKVAEKYNLSHIFCFARKSNISNDFNAFGNLNSGTEIDLHHFLLFITKGSERVEHEIQDYINNHFKSFKVTALSHSFENARNAIAQGNRFFVTAFKGITMYHDKETFLDIEMPKLNPATTLEKAEKRFRDHIRMASGFLHSASICIRNEKFFENGVFSLHQAVEQACIALIKVHTGYRIDLHNIARLLNLCRFISEQPAHLFLPGDQESERLFQILRDSYGNARYKEDFKIDEIDAVNILEKVAAFVELAENICLDWINNLRTEISNNENSNIDVEQTTE
ncbi:HEPN domain-containing protein [Mucilaginibacter flavus]|uniref:HEPN domain-containing protein n=1 Tax=Mucilaginibacter flavus TaxID=931504 RepID=UPI0025B3B4F5|nr:HEPN domain-containing protein [Mucilaginibacter flavus]MDN3584499.1 HEPN domain-containing protein [Mucilaginibacter flavus]